jgi:hypothetical protein
LALSLALYVNKIGATFYRRRDDVAKAMTSAQVLEAQKLARDWKPEVTAK